jgi:dTMP kinase
VSPGFFLAIEGLDGAGKTTLALNLQTALLERGRAAVVFKEPTHGAIGQRIRELTRDGRPAWLTPEAELELFVTDRASDVANHIQPALAAGQVVILDRYIISNLAYQGALGLEPAKILEANRQFPWPEATIILDLEPTVGLRRVAERGGQFHLAFENLDYQLKVKAILDAIDLDQLDLPRPSSSPQPRLFRLDGHQPAPVLAHQSLTLLWPLICPKA